LAGESFAREIGVLAAKGGDAVLCVDRIRCHFAVLFAAHLAVMTFITPKHETSKSILRLT
jgi:hypothetical protein